MTMISYRLLAAAALAWHYGTAGAGPVPNLDSCPDGVRTLETQHTHILTITPILVSTHCPYDMDLVIDHANTIPCTNAPTDISTIVTITNTGSPSMTSLENGAPAKPTETGKLPPPNTVNTQAESAGAPGQSSQMSDIGNSNSRPTGSGASGDGYSKTGHAASHTDEPSASSRPGSSNSKPSISLTSNSASSPYSSLVSLIPEASSSGNSLTWSPAFASSTANSSSGTASSEPTSSRSAASPGESSAVEGSQTTGSPSESSAESSSRMGTLPTQASQTGILSLGSSRTATSQSINTQRETSADTTQTETSRSEVPQSMGPNTEASPTGTSQTETSQTSQAATSGSAETSPSESLSASLSSPMTTVTPSATETTTTPKPSSPSSLSADSSPSASSSTSISSFTSAGSSTSISSFTSASSSPSTGSSPSSPSAGSSPSASSSTFISSSTSASSSPSASSSTFISSSTSASSSNLASSSTSASSTSSSTSTTSSTCSPAAPTKICATGLPQPCQDLANLSGINLNIFQDAMGCTSALGAFAKDVSQCFVLGPLDLLSPWKKVVNCLQGKIGDMCLPQLPDACTGLAGQSGVNLAANVAACTVQLGPFAVGKTFECLKGGFFNGDDIVACLRGTTGLGLSACAPAGPACVSALPPDCDLLGGLNGLDISLSKLKGCAEAIGSYGGGVVAKCLNPAAIVQTTLGGGVVTCLRDALKDVCIPTLPEACFNLITLSGGQLTTQLPQCIDALGPFKSGAVLDCITKPTSGPGVVLCLRKAIFGS